MTNETPSPEEAHLPATDQSVTPKEIANIYSHLQTMIGSVPKSPRLSDEARQRPPTPITPTHSSPIKQRKPDCACHHILVSKDSQHCALCDDIIPTLSELQQDKEKRRQELDQSHNALSIEQGRRKTLEQDVATLNKKCEESTKRLYERTEQQTALERDLKALTEKYELERAEAKKARQAKQDVENELEELSQKLFEEANDMVANEKREKHQIQIQLKHLQDELKSCKEQMEAEEMQLRELKKKMANVNEKRVSGNSHLFEEDDLSTCTSEEDYGVDKKASRDLSELLTPTNRETNFEEDIDPWVLQEFQDLVESSESVVTRKIHSVAYMKHSLTEDIEPCLRFGPHSRLVPKKLYEAMLLNTCFIEEAPYGYAQDQAKRPWDEPLKVSAGKSMIWELLSASSQPNSHLTGCQACGRDSVELPYRFRISMLDDWACVDRYCRDRLVSVCEFYTFIRNVRQGYYNGRNILDLYQESVRLKLQMFYARVGALSQTLHNMGSKGDMIGHASGPNMIIPPPSKSERDYCSSTDANSSSNNSTSSLNESIQSQNQTRETLSENSTHPGNSVWKNL
ncbi:unnamed protein product [Rhizopus stolonifer]